jgi:phosphatidylglycerophosphate synthase
MKSSDSLASPAAPTPPAPGRPAEIEEPTNRYLVHPLSRAVATALIRTPITPNQVSVASVFMAAGAGGCFLTLSWPWAALGGLLFQFAWHVLDGADGDLARRTGRASPVGELMDGICDHLSQAILYLALATVLMRQIGPSAWALAIAAALSHFIQANAYETGRKTYRSWVYGAGWIRQTLGSVEKRGPLQGALGRIYLWVSIFTNPGEDEVERSDPLGAGDGEWGEHYRELFAPLIRSSFWLSGNTRTMAIFVSLLAGSPAWFFLFEVTALNLALVWITVVRGRRNAALVRELSGPSLRGEPPGR